MKVYYARPICVSGSSREWQELDVIKAEFKDAEIVNPGDSKYMWPRMKDHMGFLLGLVDQCDVVVFSVLYGKVTAGVGLEVNRALAQNKPVYEIRDNLLSKVSKPVEMISREETRELFRKFWAEAPKD